MQALEFYIFRIELEPVGYLKAPVSSRGNMLRGAFGWVLRRQVCPDQNMDCRICTLQADCPYRKIFSPAPPPDSEKLSKNFDIPRPFVMRPDLSHKDGYKPYECFPFELVLVGQCVDFLPYFIVAFRELGEMGIGPQRTRYRLKWIYWINPFHEDNQEEVLYDHEEGVVHSSAIRPISWSDIEKRAERMSPCRLSIRFLTPTEIKADGKIVPKPEFHHLLKRLRDRINALSFFYCGEAMDIDFLELGKLAEEIKTIHSNLRWVSRRRRSTRTGQEHSFSGITGDIAFEGDLTPFLPFFALGEYLHVGKGVAFGNGRYEIIR